MAHMSYSLNSSNYTGDYIGLIKRDASKVDCSWYNPSNPPAALEGSGSIHPYREPAWLGVGVYGLVQTYG